MVQLITRRPKVDPSAQYEAVTSFASGNDVFRPGFRVRGDHPAVVKHRALFVPADLDDLEKAAARREHQTAAHARAAAERPRQDPPPVAKPPAGPMRAVVSVTILDEALGGPRPLTAGTVVDASSAVYRAFPHLFVPVEAAEMAAILTRTAGSVGLRSAGELGHAGTTAPVDGAMPFVAGRLPYDTWTEIDNSREGHFMERCARGSFTRTLKEDRAQMRMLFQHGQDPLIGMRPIAAIDGLGEDGAGVWYFGRLFDTIAGRELRPLLEAKPAVLGSSFRFRIMREHVDDRPARSDYNPERLPERTILDLTLIELGPVTFSAYSTATAGTSTGAHPPRSAPRAAPAPAISVDEFVRRLSSSPPETAAERAARQRWLDRVAPLPKGL